MFCLRYKLDFYVVDELQAQAVAKSWGVNFSKILRPETTSGFAEYTLQL